MSLSPEAARITEVAKAGNIIAGADTIEAFEARLGEVQAAQVEQRPLRQAASEAADAARHALAIADGKARDEAETLAALDRAEQEITRRIADKREQARRDQETRERIQREAEARHRRQVEEEIRTEARRRAAREAQDAARAGQ